MPGSTDVPEMQKQRIWVGIEMNRHGPIIKKSVAMDRLIKLEELGQFLLAIALFSQLSFPWWFFPACILLPDLSMLGYLHSPKFGALTYNIFHHKLLAIAVMILGYASGHEVWVFVGLILFGHAAMDRIFGYGLKFGDSFHHTHLGWIGRGKSDTGGE